MCCLTLCLTITDVCLTQLRLSPQSFLPSVKLAPVAAPTDDQIASDVVPPTTLTPSTTPYQPPYSAAQSPLERLPLEIREHICQLVGLKNPSPWPRCMRYVKWEDRHQPCNRRRCCQKSLCALSLVSKSMAAPAQRALFKDIILDRPRTLVNLCKSLLLYPKNRGYIRHLVVRNHKYMGQRSRYDRPGERHSHPYDQPDASAFVNLLGPVVMEQGASSVWALKYLRDAYSSYHETPRDIRIDTRSEAFSELTDTIFTFIVHFSSSLQSLVIRGSGKPWIQPFQYNRRLFLDHNPPITTLTLDSSVLQNLFETKYGDNFRHPCLSTVQDLTLNGFCPSGVGWVDNPGVKLDGLFDWFCTNPRLRRLEVNKFDDMVFAWDRQNWNTILPKFKDTLHHLSMSGYKERIQEDQMIFRFGPSRILTYLPELEKLAYLRVPLHFVSPHRPQPLRDMGAPPGGSGLRYR